jgi:hypothetical protein
MKRFELWIKEYLPLRSAELLVAFSLDSLQSYRSAALQSSGADGLDHAHRRRGGLD